LKEEQFSSQILELLVCFIKMTNNATKSSREIAYFK
jgi:hypothetical protein